MSNTKIRTEACPMATAMLTAELVNSLTLETYEAVVSALLMTSRGIDQSGKQVAASAALGNEARALGDAGARFVIAHQMQQAAVEITTFFNISQQQPN
jgi:hypothetical protein